MLATRPGRSVHVSTRRQITAESNKYKQPHRSTEIWDQYQHTKENLRFATYENHNSQAENNNDQTQKLQRINFLSNPQNKHKTRQSRFIPRNGLADMMYDGKVITYTQLRNIKLSK